MVWGNLYIQLRVIPQHPVVPDRSAIEPLEPIAHRLDEYLVANGVEPGLEHRPDFQLRTPASERLRVGQAVVVSAGGHFARVDGSSSNCGAVIYAGRKDGTDADIEFFAVGEGDAELCLHVAHKDTLLPATKKWKVTVAADTSC